MTIGYVPLIDTVVLVPGQDFVHNILVPIGVTILSGTTAELDIYDSSGVLVTSWSANVTSDTVSWTIASTLSDAVAIPATYRIYIHYPDGTDLCWYRGTVSRQE